MRLTSAKCPNCGADIKVNCEKEKGNCGNSCKLKEENGDSVFR